MAVGVKFIVALQMPARAGGLCKQTETYSGKKLPKNLRRSICQNYPCGGFYRARRNIAYPGRMAESLSFCRIIPGHFCGKFSLCFFSGIAPLGPDLPAPDDAHHRAQIPGQYAFAGFACPPQLLQPQQTRDFPNVSGRSQSADWRLGGIALAQTRRQ